MSIATYFLKSNLAMTLPSVRRCIRKMVIRIDLTRFELPTYIHHELPQHPKSETRDA